MSIFKMRFPLLTPKCVLDLSSWVQSKADSRVFARKRHNLHCDAPSALKNSTWALKTTANDSALSFLTCVYFYVYEVAMQNNLRSLDVTIIT